MPAFVVLLAPKTSAEQQAVDSALQAERLLIAGQGASVTVAG